MRSNTVITIKHMAGAPVVSITANSTCCKKHKDQEIRLEVPHLYHTEVTLGCLIMGAEAVINGSSDPTILDDTVVVEGHTEKRWAFKEYPSRMLLWNIIAMIKLTIENDTEEGLYDGTSIH